MRAPISRASSITLLTKPRTRSSERMRSVVAPVIALTGFMVMLPHSLNQMSFWICGDRVTSMLAARSVRPSTSSRGVGAPQGSPTIRPLPKWCCAWPGSGSEQLACTTQPITCRVGTARVMLPSGSVASSRVPDQRPPKPSKNHQGTPFIAVITMLSWPSSGAMPCATPRIAGALTATMTRSCGPSSAGRSLTVTGALSVCPAIVRRRPCARSASSAAPRATTLTAQPDCANFTPSQPPMAPAP